MLLELSSTAGSAQASFDLSLSFPDLSRDLPTPSAWQFQLGYLLNSDLDLPARIHMLDRAVGLGALLDLVRVQVLDSTVWVHCGLVDGAVVEWYSPSSRFVSSLEAISKDIEAMKAEENKFKSAVELEEGQRRRTRHQHTQSLEPVSLGRKSWAHKRQKSFLHTIVSAVGSIMSPRSSPPSHARSFSRNDFPVSPSPSPPLSSDSPSPDLPLASQHAHTYTYGVQHKVPHPAMPWSPPRTPLSPTLPQSPSARSYHQARMQEHHRRISAQLVDVYRRFVLEALVFAFAKEAGLVSEALPAPPSPYGGPIRSSVNAPTVFNYRLWLLRSMVRSVESEMLMIEESCRAYVREDFERAQAQDLEDEMDISDGNISVNISPRSAMDQGRRSCGASAMSPPTSPTLAARQKVSFDSFASGTSLTKASGEHELTKKKSRGKLVKKRSFAALLGDKGDKDAKEKEKDKTDSPPSQRSILGLKRSWGRSKPSATPVPSPVTVPPPPAELPTIEGDDDLAPISEQEAVPGEDVADVLETAPQDPSHLSVPSDTSSGQVSRPTSLYASRRESSSTTESTSSGSMATIESVLSSATDETLLTVPTASDTDLSKVEEEEGLGVLQAEPISPLGEEEEQDIGVDAEAPPGPYSNRSASKSTLNILDQLNPACAASSSSLLIPLTDTPNCTPTGPSIAHGTASPIPDINSPDFQLTVHMRLKLNPDYTRLSQRAFKLRELISAAEVERRDILEEEERYLDILEVRSRRRAWSNGVLGRCSCVVGQPGTSDAHNINSDLVRCGLSAPFKSSGLASPLGMWTNEEAENEGWEYVVPPNPHPLFHGGGVVMSMAFPSLEFGEPPDVSPRMRMMRKVDLKMHLQMERERRREAAMDCEGAFGGGGMGVVDDREEDMDVIDGVVGGVFEPVLDPRWDAEALLDTEQDGETADDLDMDIDDDVFGPRHPKDLNDLANIPPRPRMNPAKIHPPPARLFAVAEEEESDDLEDTPTSGGAATETETETEGEGDEFEFDNVDMSRRTILRNEALSDESEDDDEAFFADIHDITDIVGDIENGLERHRRHPHRRRRRHPMQRSPPQTAEPHQTPRGHQNDQLEGLGFGARSPAYSYDSFDVDMDMDIAGQPPRPSSLEFEVGGEARGRGKSTRHRIKTPYPNDVAEALANNESGVEDESPKVKRKTSKKRPRNHRRQWQAMLAPGSHKDAHDEDISGGIEITLEAERPKPRFMPAIKAIMGRGLKVRRSAEPAPELPKEEAVASPSSGPTMHHNGTPRARTTSMYHRQPSPHSRAALSGSPETGPENAKAGGMGLPLDVGFGYGTYSNTPSSKPPSSERQFSESSLLCQPVRFSTPGSAAARPQLATKSLVAAPPVFTAPPSAGRTRPRKHIRSVHLNLDLEDATVEHYEMAGYGHFGSPQSPTSPSSSQWSECSHSPGDCDSTCSSASLPMSPTPFSPPSPVVGIATSFTPLGLRSPVIRAMEAMPENRVAEDVWPEDVEELNLDAPRPSDKKQFHLPFSLAAAARDTTHHADAATDGASVDVDMSVIKAERRLKPVPERKSVLADPTFFEPPSPSPKEGAGVEIECR